MRAVTDGRLPLGDEVRRHLDLCLDCRACESACPSGVQYGRLIESFRIGLAKQEPKTGGMGLIERLVAFHLTPYPRRLRWALAPVRALQRTGIDRLIEKIGLLNLLPRSLQRLEEMLPRLTPHYGRLPEVLPAEGKRRARVALFTGCASDV